MSADAQQELPKAHQWEEASSGVGVSGGFSWQLQSLAGGCAGGQYVFDDH